MGWRWRARCGIGSRQFYRRRGWCGSDSFVGGDGRRGGLRCSCVWRLKDLFFFFSSRRRHTRFDCDWSSDVCSSDLPTFGTPASERPPHGEHPGRSALHGKARVREAGRRRIDRPGGDHRLCAGRTGRRRVRRAAQSGRRVQPHGRLRHHRGRQGRVRAVHARGGHGHGGEHRPRGRSGARQPGPLRRGLDDQAAREERGGAGAAAREQGVPEAHRSLAPPPLVGPARAPPPPPIRSVPRHIGPSPDETRGMLATLGYDSLDAFIDAVIPEDIRLRRPLALPPGRTEREVLQALRGLAAQNQLYRSYIGMGYHHSFTPQVIQRNIVENPGWYTAYTPYQPEIAQGRLEALLNFQTMVADLTALPIANASLLDEATAAAEAMNLTEAVAKVPPGTTPMFMIAEGCHPQTIAVVRTRAEARGVQTVIADPAGFEFRPGVIGALLQYPTTEGKIEDYRAFCDKAHAAGALVTVATDLLALTVLLPPGEWGADIAVGNSQRFGVPMGYGGPHAAFFATREAHRRHVPGRIIGVSRDAAGRPALRMALQTREQHIRREKATSNICTAQVLLAVMAGMYAVYHGPEGLRRIAERVHTLAVLLGPALTRLGYRVAHSAFLDTLSIEVEARDLSLTSAMIPLGSCTMKLNATTEMVPISWREFNRLHPFAPREQATGYRILFRQLEDMLAEITGFPKVSLQPNSGAQGEFTGLLVIRAYHRSRGEGHRTTCLIPTSAHGTNPASAVLAGLRVVPVRSDERGNIDLADLRAKAAEHKDTLAALMITYPSTHGVFEASIRQVCEIIHAHGGQGYMDGANMNAQGGLVLPADGGADVCHLNLHKTFCIPHGGGGPGMGPICVAAHLGPFLPDPPGGPL